MNMEEFLKHVNNRNTIPTGTDIYIYWTNESFIR